MLESFANDNLAALWDMQHPYRLCGESPETTITNLGAYVKHVHLKDSELQDGKPVYALIGEGSLPIAAMMDALRSVNYDGFISLEWDPLWYEELGDPDIIFPHFIGYMSRFDSLARAQSSLYWNRAVTGNFVWKKDSLIDLTFPQVLDRMVEEFPDQYCLKYSTLDYTRTYVQFRDDVDRFARALIDMGVKHGDKVSIWATNVPQWYITFWAVTKIGAVLVTVHTAYKIREAEYLLRQSDTHTLVLIRGYRDSDYATLW
jgi:fatty-acyl-CoA synthase